MTMSPWVRVFIALSFSPLLIEAESTCSNSSNFSLFHGMENKTQLYTPCRSMDGGANGKGNVLGVILSEIPSNSLVFISDVELYQFVDNELRKRKDVILINPLLLTTREYQERIKKEYEIVIDLSANPKAGWHHVMYELFMQSSYKHYFLIEGKVVPWTYSYLRSNGLLPELLKDKGLDEYVANDGRWLALMAGLIHGGFIGKEDLQVLSAIRTTLASMYYTSGLKELAGIAYRDAIMLDPHSKESLIRITDFLAREKKYSEADYVINTLLSTVDSDLAMRLRALLQQQSGSRGP